MESTSASLTAMEQDEMTIRQQEEIEKEISTSSPLLTDPAPVFQTLGPNYTGDEVYTAKLQSISTKYGEVRQSRPDGNCFYRCFLYGLFENFVEDPEFKAKVLEKVDQLKDKLKEAGYTQFTVDDFYDHFKESLVTLATLKKDEILPHFFAIQAETDYLTVFLRIITAAELVSNASFYENFLEGWQSIQAFVKTEVEPMGKEADHLQIISLATAMQVGVRVVYMDRGDTTIEHQFPEGLPCKIVMLYRPGHYDLIYPLSS